MSTGRGFCYNLRVKLRVKFVRTLSSSSYNTSAWSVAQVNSPDSDVSGNTNRQNKKIDSLELLTENLTWHTTWFFNMAAVIHFDYRAICNKFINESTMSQVFCCIGKKISPRKFWKRTLSHAVVFFGHADFRSSVSCSCSRRQQSGGGRPHLLGNSSKWQINNLIAVWCHMKCARVKWISNGLRKMKLSSLMSLYSVDTRCYALFDVWHINGWYFDECQIVIWLCSITICYYLSYTHYNLPFFYILSSTLFG